LLCADRLRTDVFWRERSRDRGGRLMNDAVFTHAYPRYYALTSHCVQS
jgi:hypothetical protein